MIRSSLLLLPLAAALVGCIENQVVLAPETVRQEFVVAGAQTDIIFYADSSESMRRELVTLGQNAQRFMDRVSAGNADWQILAVTSHTGCGNDGIIRPDTPDAAGVFADAIATSAVDASKDEWGLHAVSEALVESDGGCNDGFLRDAGSLHVIFLSDEDDNSPGFDTNSQYWRGYVDDIVGVKDNAGQVRFSAVGGPMPDGCEGADPSYGYWDAVMATGGQFLSICEDWSGGLDTLADASVSQELFELEREPLSPESIAVSVNDVDRLEGWQYEPELNAVRFTQALPWSNDEVVIAYRAMVEQAEQ